MKYTSDKHQLHPQEALSEWTLDFPGFPLDFGMHLGILPLYLFPDSFFFPSHKHTLHKGHR